MRHLGMLMVLSRERALHGLLVFAWIAAVTSLGASVCVALNFSMKYW
jgi:hypothetical protein